jgi:mRNA interferase RelE/StbE
MGIRYVVRYHPLVVRKDISKIDAVHRLRIKTAIEQKLLTRPDLFGIPLRRSLKGDRKLRVGDYRIVYRIESRVVFIFAIMHRSVVYEKIRKRI